MPNYRRNYVVGGTYFFTLVTFQRRKFFDTPDKLDHLLSKIRQVQRNKPFDLLAYCLLPDHVHLLIKLPEETSDFSIRIREIKRLTTLWIKHETKDNIDRIWQDKFWEHTIRDEKDLQRHFDYIHYNPVKHNLTESFDAWTWSSYRQYYDANNNRFKAIDTDQFDQDTGLFGD